MCDIVEAKWRAFIFVLMVKAWTLEKWKLCLEIMQYFKKKLLSHVLWGNTIMQITGMHLTQFIGTLYLKKSKKFWDWLLQCPPDGLLSPTKHSYSPDILYQIYLEGFRPGNTSCQESNIKYFFSGRVILAAVRMSIQELFSLNPKVTVQVQEDRSTLAGTAHLGV